jgi:sigma-E factor negative regulatory protein RseC
MIEEKAYVVAKDYTHAWIEAERRSSCDGCQVNKGCGTGAIAQFLGQKPIRIRVANPVGAEVGDEVIVGIPEGVFLQGSAMIYIAPLLTLFLGAGLGEFGFRGWGDESLVIGLGFGGLAVGFWGLRYTTVDRLLAKRNCEPQILRLVSRNRIKIQPMYFVE